MPKLVALWLKQIKNARRLITGRAFYVFFYTRYTRGRIQGHTRRTLATAVALMAIGVPLVGGLIYPSSTQAAGNNTINFEARLQTSAGAVVADGNYNVEFKLYSAASGGTALWTEDYLDSASQGVQTADGYMSVSLGSVTSFPTTINWDQPLWLTMNIGGTTTSGTPTWDGEMNPRLALTAVPYAFTAGNLALQTGSNESTLGFATQTGANSLLLPDESGTLCVEGSVNCNFAPITGGSGYIQNGTSQQVGANFNLDGSGVLGTSLSVPLIQTLSGSLSLQGADNSIVETIGSSGVQIKTNTDSSTAFLIQDSNSTPIFNIDTSSGRVGIDNSSPQYALDVNGDINSSTAVRVGGVSVCTVSACVAASGSNNYIQNTTATQDLANLSIRSFAANAVTAMIQGASGQTADILDIATWDGSSTNVVDSFGNDGRLTINGAQPSSGNATMALNVTGGTGANTASAGNGGGINLQAGNGGSGATANGNGGSIKLSAGAAGTGAGSAGTPGGILIQNQADSGTAFQIQNSAGTSNTFVVDTVHSKIGIGTATPTQTLDVNGNSNFSGFVAIGTTLHLSNASSGVVNVDKTGVPLILQTGSGQLIYKDGGNALLNINGVTGQTIFQSATNTATAFQIQDSTGSSNLLVADTTVNRVGIGATPANSVLTVGTNSTGSGGGITFGTDTSAQIYRSGGGVLTVSGGLTVLGTLSSPTAGTGSEAFGAGASIAGGTNNLAVGANASITGTGGNSTVIGASAAAKANAIALGEAASANAANAIAIGIGASTNQADSIVLGDGATATASGQLVIGGPTSGTNAIQNVIIGNGVTSTAPVGFTLQATNATGANVSGGSITIAAGQSTGTASGGNLAFQISPQGGVSGAGANALATVETLSGVSGAALFQNATNSTTGFVIQDSGSTPILSVDTSHDSVVIGSASSTTYTLNVAGTINASSNIYVNGSPVCTASTCTGGGGGTGGSFIQSGTTVQSANFNIQSASTTAPAAVIQGATSSSKDLLDLVDGSSNKVFQESSAGALTLTTSTNSTSAFLVQDANGSSALDFDTTTNTLTINQGNVNINGLSAPSAPTLATSCTSCGSLAAHTYLFKLAAIGTNGTTVAVASSPASLVTAANSINKLSWTAVPGATGYNIYRSQNNGSSWFVNTVSATATSILDDGSTFAWATGATPPTKNSARGELQIDGTNALQLEGTQTVFVGTQNLVVLTTGDSDSAVGFNALNSDTTGSNNTGIGKNALTADNTGASNTGVGANALLTVTTGGQNASLGANAGSSVTTGSGDSFLGSGADMNNGVMGQLQNASSIGIDSFVAASNTISLGCTNGLNGCTTTTSVGIGTGGLATGLLSVGNQISTAGTITTLSGSGAVGGSGTAFSAAMVGGTIFYADGGSGTITAVASTTTLTSSNTTETEASGKYGISYAGFNISSNATASLQTISNSASAFQILSAGGAIALKVSTNNLSTSNVYDSADNAMLDVAEDNTNGRSINVAGTVNLSGHDYAEWIPWNGPGPAPAEGAIVNYQGSSYVASSPFTAGIIGNDNDGQRGVLVTFVGQVDVDVTGPVNAGDILVDNGDGTARAVSPSSASIGELLGKIAIAQESSSDPGVKSVMASVGSTSNSVASALQNQSATFANLSVAGSANLGDLNVSGQTTLSNLKVTGSALFRNSADSQHGFQVENAAGDDMFNVDTQNGVIQVGSAQPSDKLVLLRLSSYSGSNAPSEADGAMYYDANTAGFRCGEEGVWRSCGGDLASTSTAASDPISNTTNTTNFSGGNNTSYTVLPNDCRPGVTYLITASGTYSTSGAPSLSFMLDEDGTNTSLANTGGFATSSNANNQGWQLTAQMVCTSSTSAEIQGSVILGKSSTGSSTALLVNSGTKAWDSTAHSLGIGVTWGSANGNNSITMRQMIVQRMTP